MAAAGWPPASLRGVLRAEGGRLRAMRSFCPEQTGDGAREEKARGERLRMRCSRDVSMRGAAGGGSSLSESLAAAAARGGRSRPHEEDAGERAAEEEGIEGALWRRSLRRSIPCEIRK